ncbi:MAG TPA: metalloregulator ArsR/SmtB family transcription factor [Sphingomonadaceae bacterium]|nr:metalloregulator ArsR/SmtB family transcription factor [Sphingomonadaceae bacterium]
MENNSASLDLAFHALADPTRRAVIRRLIESPAPVAELAEPFAMGLPAFLKHIRVLEESGWIASEKKGRVRTCRMLPERLRATEEWLTAQRKVWEGRTDRLATYVETHLATENHP